MIINYTNNTTCCSVPFASLRTVICSTATKVFFYEMVTEQLKTASPFSLTRASHFLVLFLLREHNAGSFLNGLMWSFPMMKIFSDFEGIFTTMAVSENI